MRRVRGRLAALLLALALIGAPALARATPGDDAADPRGLGAYLRGRLAEADGRPALAIAAYAEALQRDPGNIAVARHAYRQAVVAGDRALALRSLRLLKGEDAPPDGLLLEVIDAFGRGDNAAAASLADRMIGAEQLSFLAPFVRSWASIGSGGYVPPEIGTGDRFSAYARRHIEEQLLWQRLALGDGAGAREALVAALGKQLSLSAPAREALASRFAALGMRDVALALLPADKPDPFVTIRARIAAGDRVDQPPITGATGIAILLDRFALDLGASGNPGVVLSLLRLASFADPSSVAIRLDVARTLVAADYPELGFEEAGRIAMGSSAWADAQVVRVAALLRQDRGPDAIIYAQNLARRPGAGPGEKKLLADTLFRNGEMARVADVLRELVAMPEGAGDARLHLQYGSALVQAGRWPEGRAELEKALVLDPANPVILNHLGYSLVEHGEQVPRAIAMLEKVVARAPEQGAYIDSLGWAYFQGGRIDKALPLLEKAVALEPAEPDINEHLGDARWRAGRRFEARQSWTAAAVHAEGDAKQRLDAKISLGPDFAEAR